MPTSETFTIITMLAPSLAAFKAMQQTHRAFQMTSAQTFMVRCRWRKLYHEPHARVWAYVYGWKLPSGRRDGLCISLYAYNKRLRACKYYTNGKNVGSHQRWHMNGQPWLLCTYVDGKRHGVHNEWYSSGQMYAQKMYDRNQLHGIRQVWFPRGQLHTQQTFVNGVLHGEFKLWRDDGRLSKHYIYDRGTIARLYVS